MQISCDQCGKAFNKKPSLITRENFCCAKCRSDNKHIEGACGNCGKSVRRLKCMTKNAKTLMCSLKCFRAWNSERFSAMNITLNPERMVFKTRLKLRQSKLGRGNGVSYEKTFGVHTHRIVAAQTLGRPLLPGEVVHHKDENKRNNQPDNLEVYSSQAEHARYHIKILNDARTKRPSRLSEKSCITYFEKPCGS